MQRYELIFLCIKGGPNMLDIIFVGSLFVGFIFLKLFTNWCDKQIENKKD